MDPRLQFVQHRLNALTAANRYRTLRPRTGSPTHGQADVISLCSNDYLGLAEDPRVKAGARQALERYGAGSTSARLISGELPLFSELEEALADWLGFETALLFPTGYHANLALLTVLPGAGGRILSDALNHASIIDGCRLSRAETTVFSHNSVASVRQKLDTTLAPGSNGISRPTVIITEGMFSMDGDLAPVEAFHRLAQEAGALLLVDDAHALGTLGEDGRGSTFTPTDGETPGTAPGEAAGASGSRPASRSRADVLVGTFGKAFGSSGAFIACPRVVREALINLARPFIFTTGPNPASVGAAQAALDIVRTDPGPRLRLQENVAYLRSGLQALGFELQQSVGHILPLVVGQEARALAFSQGLLARGVDIRAIRPPTVPEGTCRLRVTLSAAHTREELARALEIIHQVWTHLPA